jgi:opacity protein-like surface antigen
MLRARLILAAMVLTIVPGLAAAGGYSHTRDGWVYGLNVGWGWAQAEAKDTSTDSSIKSDWIDDFTGGFRVAFAPDDTYTYGLELSGWSEPAGGLDETVFWILLQGTWYPGGQGLFVHGGVGMGALNLSATTVAATVSQTNGGFAWGVGAGYEFRVSPTLALGLAYDYRDVSVGEVGYFDNVSTAIQSATLAVTWYMD